MSSAHTNQYYPDYITTPGEILLEYSDMLQAELSDRTGLAKKTVNEIIRGKSKITPEIARKLEKVVGQAAHFWSNLERRYQDDKVRLAERKQMASYTGWLPKHRDKIDQVESLLRSFGIASPDQWEMMFCKYRVSCRQSKSFTQKFPANLNNELKIFYEWE
jgi:HTH-type transcriptional regulator/antitoxin HigA